MTVKNPELLTRFSYSARTSPSVTQHIAAVVTGFPRDDSSNLIPLNGVARLVLVEVPLWVLVLRYPSINYIQSTKKAFI